MSFGKATVFALGVVPELSYVDLADINDDTTATMARTPVAISGFSKVLNWMRPAYSQFALGYNKDLGSKGAVGRVIDSFSESLLTMWGGVVNTEIFSNATAKARHNVVVGGAEQPSCKAPSLQPAMAPHFWASSPMYEVTAHDKLYLGSIRCTWSGSRSVAAVHLPTLIRFILLHDSHGYNLDWSAVDPEKFSSVQMSEMKAWLRTC